MPGIAEAVAALTQDRDLLDGTFGQPVIARADQLVFAEGDPADTVYLLVEGIVRCHVSVAQEGPAERTTLLCEGPALLGDRDAIAEVHAAESVSCLTAARLVTWPSAELRRTLAADAAFEAMLLRDLARRYARSMALAGLSLAPLGHTVAALLLEVGADPERAGAAWIARALSVAPKSVTRAFAQLRKEGVLRSESGEALRLDEGALAALGLPDTTLIHSLSR